MYIELLKQTLQVAGKCFMGVVADTPKGPNDTTTVVWIEIPEKEYNDILSRCANEKEFRRLDNLTPKGLETKLLEVYKR